MKDNSGLFLVSTIKVTDRKIKPYETALCLNKFDIKIFEIYETENEAKEGHLKWVEKAKHITLDDYEKYVDLVDNYEIDELKACELLKGLEDI